MAGTLKPNVEGLGKEVGYIIHNYSLYDPAEYLFDGSRNADNVLPASELKGTYSRNAESLAYWFTTSHFLDIEFLGNVRIWDIGGLPTHVHRLDVYDNAHGIQGSIVGSIDRYIGTGSLTTLDWRPVAELKKGRYLLKLPPTSEVGGLYRISYEWYLESTFDGKTLIKHNGELKKWNEEVKAEAVNLIPSMTSLNTPSGNIIYSGYYREMSNYSPINAFSDNTLTGWISTDGVNNGWIGYDFEELTEVDEYAVTSSYDSNLALIANASDWTFEGSDDGEIWVELDKREGVSFSNFKERKTFALKQTATYKMYRLNITRAYDFTAYVGIGRLNMYRYSIHEPAHWSVETDFQNGMDDLSILDRKLQNLVIPTTKQEEFLVSEVIDTKKLIDVKSITVEL